MPSPLFPKPEPFPCSSSLLPSNSEVCCCDGGWGGKLFHLAEGLFKKHIASHSLHKPEDDVFGSARKFDKVPRGGPKAFVSEYAVTGDDAGKGSLLAALSKAGFIIGLEKN